MSVSPFILLFLSIVPIPGPHDLTHECQRWRAKTCGPRGRGDVLVLRSAAEVDGPVDAAWRSHDRNHAGEREVPHRSDQMHDTRMPPFDLSAYLAALTGASVGYSFLSVTTLPTTRVSLRWRYAEHERARNQRGPFRARHPLSD